MERMLLKMAGQLNAHDEASLMALWEKYATLVEHFEPSKRWEEAAIVLSLIQAVRLKNQLFNQHLAASAAASKDRTLPGFDRAATWMEQKANADSEKASAHKGPASPVESAPKKRRKILKFQEKSETPAT